MSGAGRRGPRSAADRVKGLLVMLPWLFERRSVSVADMAAQFGVNESDLIADLELVAMCGVPPYSPGELTDVYIDEGYIHVGINHNFERRIELTAAEAFGLTLLAEAAEDLPGFRKKKELKGALSKLAKVLGAGLLDVDVEESEHLELMSEAARTGEKVRMVYFTPASGERKERTVAVRSVFSDRGHWYITADDDLTGQTRHFRLDRVESAAPTGERVEVAPTGASVPEWFSDGAGHATVTLDLDPGAAWVAETYPCTVVSEAADGAMRVRMVASSEHWLGRLLLRAGGGATVVEPMDLGDLGERVARQVLEVYRENSSGN